MKLLRINVFGIFAGAVLAGCGGGGGGSSSEAAGSGADKVINTINSNAGTMLISSGSTVLLDDKLFFSGSGCDTNSIVTKAEISPLIISESANGVCVDDEGVTECLVVNSNTILTHFHDEPGRKYLEVFGPANHKAEVIINNNAFDIAVLSPKSDCTSENSTSRYATPDGVYQGNIYSFANGISNTTGAATISEPFSLTCSAAVCAESGVIDTMGAGLNMTEAKAKTAIDTFRLASSGVTYDFYSTTSVDGGMITGVAVPPSGACEDVCLVIVLTK